MTDVVLLGVGNPLMGDDGIGLVALEQLRSHWVLPEEVELIDGGTWGMQLLPTIEAADEVIILDAIRAGSAAGAIVRLEKDELPRFFRAHVSPHHITLEDVFAVLEFKGTAPERISALGLEPQAVTWGMGLSPVVEAAIPDLVTTVVTRLRERGHTVRPRELVDA